jgi:mediator of RNA polymerase II transcription subunit 17
MVLDGPVQTEPVEQRTYVQLFAKKRALEVPSKILLQGADHLKNLQNETKGSRSPEDFHIELLRLRQNWRLKKVGNTILGDLSYRTAGSQFRQSGMFEVTKADDTGDAATAAGAAAGGSPASSSQSGVTTKPRSALKVTVPSELEGIAYIQVTIQRDNEQLVSATLGQFSGVPQKGAELHWQNKLEAGRKLTYISYAYLHLTYEFRSGARFILQQVDSV